MSNRNSNRKISVNQMKMYEEQLSSRNINWIKQYTTPTMSYPKASQLAGITTKTHIWSVGDRYYKLAHENYGDPKLWWVVAWFNQKPTEAHLKTGEIVYIPLPLDRVLSHMGSY